MEEKESVVLRLRQDAMTIFRSALAAVDPEEAVRRHLRIEAGALALDAAEVRRLPAGVSSLEADLYPALIAGGRMQAWVTTTPFYDIGTPDGLRRAEAFFARR